LFDFPEGGDRFSEGRESAAEGEESAVETRGFGLKRQQQLKLEYRKMKIAQDERNKRTKCIMKLKEEIDRICASNWGNR
jgi:hypothetical protein